MVQLDLIEYIESLEKGESITLRQMDRVTSSGIVFDWDDGVGWMTPDIFSPLISILPMSGVF